MMSRVFSPAATMQPASSIAQLGGMIGAADSIPALGFARAGHGPSASSSGRQLQSAMHTRPNTSHGLAPEPAYQTTYTQETTKSQSSKHPAHTFNTSMRNAEARYNPLQPSRRATMDVHPHRAPNSSNTLSGNSTSPPRTETSPRLGHSAQVTFASARSPLMQSHSATTHAREAPQNPYAPRSPQPVASSSTPAPPNQYSYQAAPSASLAPPRTLTNLHRRSPSPILKLDTHTSSPKPAPVVNHRQATFIDSPIDYYSRLDSKVSALPPTSAYEASPQSSIPAGPLISITTPIVTPTQTQPSEPPRHHYSYAAHPQTTYNPQLRMCVVCFDPEPTVRFAARSPTPDCAHGATVCTSCLENHILVAIHHNRNVDVRCPHDGCGKTLEYKDVYASVRDWGRLAYYEALLLRREMENEENFVWCKNSKCGAGQIHKSGKSRPVVVCITCNSKSCFKHDRPWHEGVSCDEYDRVKRDEEDNKATDQYLANNTKACPKCKRNIERNGGCDHMLCKPPGGCGHEFCWECLESKGHKKECTHYVSTRRARVRRR